MKQTRLIPGLTEPQSNVIRYALADLIGAYQDWKLKGCPDSFHRWDAHLESIEGLAGSFGLEDEVPEDLEDWK